MTFNLLDDVGRLKLLNSWLMVCMNWCNSDVFHFLCETVLAAGNHGIHPAAGETIFVLSSCSNVPKWV